MVEHRSTHPIYRISLAVLLHSLMILQSLDLYSQSSKTLTYISGSESYTATFSFQGYLLNTQKDKKALNSQQINVDEVQQYEVLLIQPGVISLPDNHSFKGFERASSGDILALIQQPTANEILYNINIDQIPGTEVLSLILLIETGGDHSQTIQKSINLTYEFIDPKPSSSASPPEEIPKSPESSPDTITTPTESLSLKPPKATSEIDPASTDATDLEAEEKIWKYTLTSGRYFDFYHYLLKYPEGQYQDIAQRTLVDFSRGRSASYSLKKSSDNPDIIEYTLKIDTTVFDDEAYSMLPPLKIDNGYGPAQLEYLQVDRVEFTLRVKKDIPMEISIIDRLNRSQTIPLPSRMEEDAQPVPVMDTDEPGIISAYTESDTLFVEIKGGIPPYTLWIQPDDTTYRDTEMIEGIPLTHKYGYLYFTDSPVASSMFLTGGILRMADSDDRYSGPFQKNPSPLSDIPAKTWALLGVALGIILITAIVLTAQKRKKNKEEVEEDEDEGDIQVNQVTPRPATSQKKIKAVRPRTRLVSELALEKYGPLSEEVRGKGWIDHSSLSHLHDGYIHIDLEDLWENTAVKDLYLSRESAELMDQFIQEKNNPDFSEDSQGVPEIGGFFLGNYSYNDDHSQYIVILEKFVPVNQEEYDVYKLEFGVEAWKTLSDVQDMYSKMETIAWFHTHPGHGLFLSQADLKIHQGFFKKRYQLAIEIDTLKEGLDIAFFTRTLNGDVNNDHDLREHANWKKWNEIKLAGADGH